MEISLNNKRTRNGPIKKKAPNKRRKPNPLPTPLPEKKVIDIVPFNETVTGGTPGIYLLNGVATGDDFNTRDGRRIRMKYLYYRWSVGKNSTGSINGNYRVCVVLDKQANGATVVYSDIFNATHAMSMSNLNNRDRFRILYNKSVTMQNNEPGNMGGPSCHGTFEEFIPLNIDTTFSGTTATANDIATGSLWLITMSDITGAALLARHCTRVRFVEF